MTNPTPPHRPQKPVKPPARPQKPIEVVRVNPVKPTPPPPKNKAIDPPITPPTEIMQYRAIGLVHAIYTPSATAINKGTLVTREGTEFPATVLGKLVSIVKKRLDLNQPQEWIVYPRTQDKEGQVHLFLQIAGVWAPQAMGKSTAPIEHGIKDGYFSVRGEVTKLTETGLVTVKIRRILAKAKVKPAKDSKGRIKIPANKFKIHLFGKLPDNAIGYFWNFNVQREGGKLVIIDGQAIAPVKKVSRKPKVAKPPKSSKPERGSGSAPRPVLRPRLPRP
jgi:hypothetical protein